MVNASYRVLSYTYTLKNTVYFLFVIYGVSFNLTFRPVTDKQTESDEYEPTVCRHRWVQQNKRSDQRTELLDIIQ